MINDEMNHNHLDEPETASDAVAANVKAQPQALVFAVKFFLAIWILFYVTLALAILINSWAHNNQWLCSYLNVKNCGTLPPIFVSALHAMLGGVLGAGVLGLTSFHRHVSIEQNFDIAHTWGYIFAPWLSAVLGLTVFVLLQSGLLIFSGEMGTSDEISIQNLAYLGIGFLSGFGWYDATRRIQKIVRNFFSGKEESAPKETAQEDAQTVEGEETAQTAETTEPGKVPSRNSNTPLTPR
ncbi:hypothetical protein FBQ81_10590 [Chloroflexi bacterium CFX6]|nr:hypothetical protein [Chloroflexi bacterium CFX6]